MQDIWKSVEGYEGLYEVSNKGQVRSLTRVIKIIGHPFISKNTYPGKTLKPYSDKDGYLRVNLYKNNNKRLNGIHRLVAKAFIPNAENKPQVNHKNGIKYDNDVKNLEWNTLCENRQHAYDTGLQKGMKKEKNPMWGKFGFKSGRHKLTEEQVLEIRKLYADGGLSQQKIAQIFKITQVNVSIIIRRITWSHI